MAPPSIEQTAVIFGNAFQAARLRLRALVAAQHVHTGQPLPWLPRTVEPPFLSSVYPQVKKVVTLSSKRDQRGCVSLWALSTLLFGRCWRSGKVVSVGLHKVYIPSSEGSGGAHLQYSVRLGRDGFWSRMWLYTSLVALAASAALLAALAGPLAAGGLLLLPQYLLLGNVLCFLGGLGLIFFCLFC
jgi:hypothetical protein